MTEFSEEVVEVLQSDAPLRVIASRLGVAHQTVWRWRQQLGIPSDFKRGRPTIDRSDWPWESLNFSQIAKRYGVSRQRVLQIHRKQWKEGFLKASAP